MRNQTSKTWGAKTVITSYRTVKGLRLTIHKPIYILFVGIMYHINTSKLLN